MNKEQAVSVSSAFLTLDKLLSFLSAALSHLRGAATTDVVCQVPRGSPSLCVYICVTLSQYEFASHFNITTQARIRILLGRTETISTQMEARDSMSEHSEGTRVP